MRRDANGLVLADVLEQLHKLGIASLLVEGGGRVLDSFIRERLFDEMAIFFSNKIVGGRNSVQIFASGDRLADALELVDCRWSEFAGGSMLRGYRKCSPDLIAATAVLVKLEKKNPPVLTIRAALDKPLAVGDSLAVNGVCLTLIEKKGDLLRFNLAAPTLRLSNLGDLPAGAPLNIEFPLAADDLLGGHLVSGHIDGTVRVRAVNKGDAELALRFLLPRAGVEESSSILRGSVALNGVSLTVSEICASWFAVEIIPQTLATTNLRLLRVGERVNIELGSNRQIPI